MQQNRAPRLAGVDITRGIAIVTMVMAHTMAPDTPAWLNAGVELLTGGERPRTVFAVTGGLAIGLLVRSRLQAGLTHRDIRLILVRRGVLLIALGLILDQLWSGVNVILATWGLMLLTAAVVFTLRSRQLLFGSLGALAVGSWISVLETPGVQAWLSDRPQLTLPAQLFAFGSYPYLEWCGMVGFGLWLATRLDLSGGGRGWRWLAVAGLPMLAVGAIKPLFSLSETSWLSTMAYHLSAMGYALLLLALLQGVVVRYVPLLARLLTPLRAVGTMPLSAYVAHILLLSGWHLVGAPGSGTWWPMFLLIAAVVVGSWWILLNGRTGPLERAMRWFDRDQAPAAVPARQ